MLDNKTYKEIERALNEERYKEYLLNYPKVIGTEDGALVYNELLRINKILKSAKRYRCTKKNTRIKNNAEVF